MTLNWGLFRVPMEPLRVWFTAPVLKQGTTWLFPEHLVELVLRLSSSPPKRRGATVTAICGPSKAAQLKELGADQVFSGRHGDPHEWASMMAKIKDSADVVIDNVGGEGFPDMIDALKRGGRYATSGRDQWTDCQSRYANSLFT